MTTFIRAFASHDAFSDEFTHEIYLAVDSILSINVQPDESGWHTVTTTTLKKYHARHSEVNRIIDTGGKPATEITE